MRVPLDPKQNGRSFLRGELPGISDLRVPGRPEIFVIGDTAVCNAWRGRPAPGLAPAAKQGGAYNGCKKITL
jgi:NADH dehydrogenase FAD-containing subunit